MSIEPKILPALPVPLDSDAHWPTFSISPEERQAINTGKLTYIKLEVDIDHISNIEDTIIHMNPEKETTTALSGSESNLTRSPRIIRSIEAEKIEIVTSEPPPLLTISIPALSFTEPNVVPHPFTSGSLRRIHSHLLSRNK